MECLPKRQYIPVSTLESLKDAHLLVVLSSSTLAGPRFVGLFLSPISSVNMCAAATDFLTLRSQFRKRHIIHKSLVLRNFYDSNNRSDNRKPWSACKFTGSEPGQMSRYSMEAITDITPINKAGFSSQVAEARRVDDSCQNNLNVIPESAVIIT